MTGAHVGGHQLAAFFDHERAQHRALRQRQPLPRFLEHRVLLAEQPRQGDVQIVEAGRLLARLLHVVPGFVREPLHVVRHVGGEIDDRFAEPVVGADAAAAEPLVDEGREVVGVDLLETHHRPGLVERPPRPEHALHQRRLGSREHVADLALILDRGAERVLDGAAVERR